MHFILLKHAPCGELIVGEKEAIKSKKRGYYWENRSLLHFLQILTDNYLEDFLLEQKTWITRFFQQGCCELMFVFFQPHSLIADKKQKINKKSPSKANCPPPPQTAAEAASLPDAWPLWTAADLNYCNQRMKSNQQPCMSRWQNA